MLYVSMFYLYVPIYAISIFFTSLILLMFHDLVFGKLIC